MDEFKIPAADDWRRQGQERYLSGVILYKRNYRLYSPTWNHDHCEFCGATFSLYEGDLKKGYSTEDCYHWICYPCFEDFRYEYNWQVIDDEESS
jgi:hypothetical protein